MSLREPIDIPVSLVDGQYSVVACSFTDLSFHFPSLPFLVVYGDREKARGRAQESHQRDTSVQGIDHVSLL